jgi:murein DD-endopeptidase MepM/ murein hydrolase activator NlpD
VDRGELIAWVGSSGIATGPHLHYEVWLNGVAQDPLNYVIPADGP